ncbi:adenylate/guanylate cyclase domain-containing protein [Glaciecola sp. XM2]|jgi:class 3 adenylate cyclase|uniref:adenylate/guanylate cyclase domain-containing protein n=1 Tax=Glaciecola sp. XM2 TaxID=1914931 RepID=UPI001BDF331D|nr:adenylate/guanylate cyclase domain-containing protein [Glaciecola sp. XM2]MBT1451027.1 adenylate/guanylate cyclase domain-containing protein [Glaciecola sp. XM2]
MFHRDSNTFSFNTKEHVMYSRRAILRRVTYLLLLVTFLQAGKWLFLPESVSQQYSLTLHLMNTLLHATSFIICLYLFRRKLFNLGKWLLQISFISFITTANLLWYNDIALQYFYLLAIFISGFMFSERETKYFLLFCALYLCLFLIFQYLYMAAMQAQVATMILPMINSAVLAGSCFSCAWLVRKMTLSNWKKAQNFSTSQTNLIYKVFPERISGKLISLQPKNQVPAQDLMYESPMSIVFLCVLNGARFMQEHGEAKALEFFDELYASFDEKIKASACLRIKLQGDQYVFVSEQKQGLDPAKVCKCLTLVRDLHRIFYEKAKGTSLILRCGVATGEVSAGIVNLGRPSFDVWGESVVLASRLEKSCQTMHVHCDEQTYQLAKERFYFNNPSEWNFKGVGKVMTHQMRLAG